MDVSRAWLLRQLQQWGSSKIWAPPKSLKKCSLEDYVPSKMVPFRCTTRLFKKRMSSTVVVSSFLKLSGWKFMKICSENQHQGKFTTVVFLYVHHPNTSLWPFWDGENVTLYLQLGDEKVTLNHREDRVFSWIFNLHHTPTCSAPFIPDQLLDSSWGPAWRRGPPFPTNLQINGCLLVPLISGVVGDIYNPTRKQYKSGMYCQLGDYISPIPPFKGTRNQHWPHLQMMVHFRLLRLFTNGGYFQFLAK